MFTHGQKGLNPEEQMRVMKLDSGTRQSHIQDHIDLTNSVI
jgi:hypothetical protein